MTVHHTIIGHIDLLKCKDGSKLSRLCFNKIILASLFEPAHGNFNRMASFSEESDQPLHLQDDQSLRCLHRVHGANVIQRTDNED